MGTAWSHQPPRKVAGIILDTLFRDDSPALDRDSARTYPLTEFQEVGARRARAAIDRWGGVIVADAVGLGKTYIALALIEETLDRGGTVLVIVPAALRPMWQPRLRCLATASVHLLSHAQLSRGGYPPALAGAAALTVVDEAHRFRNPATRRYSALSELCRNGDVALLTATPINNGPADLYHLLRLFVDDHAFAGIGVPSLRLLLEPGAAGLAHARPVLDQVVIRRNRSMVAGGTATEASGDGAGGRSSLRFPHRLTPRVVRFEDPRLPALVAGIAALELAPYSVWESRMRDHGVPTLLRLGLLKRLESGGPALERSLQRLSGFFLSFITALERGRLLTPTPRGPPGSARDADPLQMVLLDVVAEPCPPGLDAGRLLASTRRDVARIGEMQERLRGADPKLEALVRQVLELDPEKCVVFAEFRDTAAALWRRLASSAATGRIDGQGAWLGLRPAGRSAVVRRFAPGAHGTRPPPVREEVRVLIATDVLAEGVNLQDARHVISYDLPWNPVRLMQRIGRVDRLGSPHREVQPHLFLPGTGLEELLGLNRTLRAKLGSIADTMGDEESLQLMERLGQGVASNPRVLDEVGARHADPMETLRIQWHARRTASGDPASDGTRPIPMPAPVPVARIDPEPDSRLRGVALLQVEGDLRLLEVHHDGTVTDAARDGARLLARALDVPDEAATAVPEREVRAIARLLQRYARATRAARRAPPVITPGDPATGLAHRVRAAVAGTHGLPERGLLARADRAIQRLGAPLPGWATAHARRLARELDDDATPELVLTRVEEVLESVSPPNRGGPPRQDPATDEEARIVAIILSAPITRL